MLRLASDQLPLFFPLLQKGVTVPATIGCTLKSLLTEQLGIPADYVTERITTIFMDNHPVDDLDGTVIMDGSRVTLSAAMPGLVGATMRRGGYYAALRGGISHIASRELGGRASGTVRLKLFNLLLAELGPLVLAHGLLMDRHGLDALAMQLNAELPVTASDQVLLTVYFQGVEA